MVKVDSKETINLISKKFIKANRGRNIIVIIAIIMTSMMFMTLFTAVTSVLESTQQHEMRKYMDSSHIGIKDLTKEQFDEIVKDKNIYNYGYTIFMTLAENKELEQTQTEIRYADENGAKGFNCLPTTGRLPKEENEIALSTITLDQLGVPRELGSKITLTFTLSDKKITKDFILCGYWKGDPICIAQLAWVSKEYCLNNCKKATKTAIENEDFEGDYNISIWCDSQYNLQKQADRLNEKYNLISTSSKAEVNPAFDQFGNDGFPIGTVAIILLIIFLSGYLIIYNIFRISVNNDIRIYGLLKNIGATGRQLKKIIRKQALILSLLGIPIGIVIGLLIGKSMTPVLVSDLNHIGVDKIEIVSNTGPMIYIITILFSFCTVYIGCMVPCRIVSKVSPVEAVRMIEKTRVSKRSYSEKISPFRMAFSNIRSTWKRSIIVIISLALPIIVLNSIFTIVKGFDYEQFLDTYISSDINVSGLTSTATTTKFNAITPEFKEAIKENSNINDVAFIYNNNIIYNLDDVGYNNLKKIINELKDEEYLVGSDLESEINLLESRKIPTHIMGINEKAFEKIEFQGHKCTWEEFNSGDYVILGNNHYGTSDYYNISDRITLPKGENSDEYKEYKVLAIGGEPFDYSYRFGTGTYFDFTFFLPETEYKNLTGNENTMLAGLYIKPGTDDEVKKWVDDYVEKEKVTLYMESRKEVRQACSGETKRYEIIGGSLCFVLFLIGIMNYFNTSSVSIMTRKRELALLEAVGMSKKQVKKMLVFEGLIYLSCSVIIADTIGTLVANLIIRRVIKAFFFTCNMSIFSSIAALPILIIIAIIVPKYHYRSINKDTVVERLRCN